MILTMAFEKIYMQMEEQGMGSHLEKTMWGFTGQNSQNSRLKFWAQMGKKFQMIFNFWFFTIYRKILKFLKFFTPFL